MKKTVIILSALALFAAVSCQKAETPVEAPKGHSVTLTVGLTPETRISHTLDGTTIKTAWEDNDFVFVQFGNQTEIFSIDQISGKTATFKNTNSNLTDSEPYTVTYASRAHMTYDASAADYGLSTFDLNSQNGKYANLPEYLVAEYDPENPGDLVLASKLTYFHFVFRQQMTSTSNPSITSIEFDSVDNQGVFKGGFYSAYGATTAGVISFVPDASVLSSETVPASNPFSPATYYANIDIYAAAFMGNQAARYQVTLNTQSLTVPGSGSGIGLPGSHGSTNDQGASGLTYTWTTSKTYVGGKVYKVTGTPTVIGSSN